MPKSAASRVAKHQRGGRREAMKQKRSCDERQAFHQARAAREENAQGVTPAGLETAAESATRQSAPPT